MDSFDVVVIVETWLDRKYQDFELKLEGYNIFRKDRCNRWGGGVLIAVRNHISCIHRSDLEVQLEMIALEIRPNPTICVLLSAFYRPDQLFLSQFREFLVKYSKFQDLLFAAVNQHIPQITLKRRSRPPWICNDIMKLIKKRKLWKQVKSNGSPDIFLKFKELRKKTKRLINTSYYNYLKSLPGKLQDNPKHFWSFYSVKSKTKRIPETVIYDICSRDTSSKVELFNKFFHSIYSIDSVDVNSPTTDVVNPNLLLNVTTTAFEEQGILRRLDIHISPGVDNIPTRILQICAKELSVHLSHLFNLSLRSGVMPTLWNSANITAIHKNNNKEFVEDYRSISLLPIPAKCLERLVHTAIYAHVSPYLSEWHHGFVKGKSWETQLVLTHHQWVTALDKGPQVDVAFLDFSKDFDRVNHSILLQKLCSFGISGFLLQWCESYLSNRLQRTVLDGVSST